MGREAVKAPNALSRAVSAYVSELVAQAGGDMSGRWLKEKTGRRSHTYWRELLIGERVVDMNDIDSLASALGIDGLEVLTEAHRRYSASEAPSNVTDIAMKRADQMTTEEIERERSVANIDPAADTDEHPDT